MAIQYYMRAFNTTLVRYVDWVVNDTPDSTGVFSGFPTNQLINITVNRIVQSKVSNFLKPNQSLGGTDGEFFHVNSYDWRNAVTPISPPTTLTGFAVERGVSAVSSITSASNTSPINVISATNHGLVTGQIVTINGVTGNVAANGSWPINVTGLTTFTLLGSSGSGTYVSGGNIFLPNDFSTLTWDETNAVWRFMLNTNGDGTTIGNSQSVKVNNFFIDGYLALGSPPLPTHGIIRLPNNQFIFGENAQGTGDIQLIGSDALNRIRLGSLTTDIVYTPGIIDVDGYIQHDGNGSNVASTGFIREQNNTAIVGFKNVNTTFADVTALSSNSFNQVVIGDSVNTGTVHNTSTSTFSITAVTATNPVQITVSAPTTFVTGQNVSIAGITGTIGTDATNGLNGKSFGISVIDTTHFTLTGSLGSGLVYTSGGTVTTNNVHAFQEGGVTQVEIGTSVIRFPAGVSAPFLTQTTATGSNSGQNLTIQSQNSGLGGTNGGNLTLTTGTGATNGILNLVIGGTTRVTLNDTTETHTHPTITFANTVVSPTITQNTTSSAPTNLTVSAQPTSQAATLGGSLNLSSGTGTSAAGNVNVQTGGTNQIIVSPNFITPGTTSSTGGSVVIRGSLEVVGTTTTVDSTVVDIIGRIIHANWADPTGSPNVAVPSQVVGYSVHRGNASGVPRDGGALIWTEGSLNSGADGFWRHVTYPGDGIGTDNFTIANSLNAVGSMASNFSSSTDPNPISGYLAASGSLRTANNVSTVVSRNLTLTTTVSATSNLQTLPQGTINVASTAGFTAAGTLLILSSTGVQTVTYTGTTGTTFTGAVGGTGTIITGSIVGQTNQSTTIAAGSNNIALPTGTINVASTVGFPASGTLRLVSRTSASATAPPSIQVITYTGTGATTFTGCTGGTGTMFTGDAVTSPPSPGTQDLVLLGTDFGNRILHGAPANNTGHIFNTTTGSIYDFQINSVSQVQLRGDADTDTFTKTITIAPTVSTPKLYQVVRPDTGANNGFNLGVFAQAGQQQTGGNNNNNGGNVVIGSGAAGTGGGGTAGINGSVDLQTGATLKVRIFPTTAVSATDNNSIIYFENLFRVDTAQTAPLFRQDSNVTNGATAQNYTVQAQNATGTTSTGGDIINTSGTGTTTAGNNRLQTGGVDKIIVHPSFTEFRDTAEAYRITPVSAGTTTLQAASTVTALVYKQADLTTNAGTGATTTLQAQNETGTTSTGGLLVLTSGTGTTTAGNVTLQTGAVDRVIVHPTFTEFRDTSEAYRITPLSAGATTLQAISTATSVTYKQGDLATASGTGATTTVQAQNETGTTSTGGALNLTSGTGTTTNGALNLQAGGVTTASVVTNKFVFNKGSRRNVTQVTNTYAVLTTDDFIAVTTLSAPFTITLPTGAATGDSYTIKDATGNAVTNTLTIDGNGNNIDGSPTFIMTQAYAAATFTFLNSQWSVS